MFSFVRNPPWYVMLNEYLRNRPNKWVQDVVRLLEEKQRQQSLMVFRRDESVDTLLQSLPSTWTVLQISLFNSPEFSRFKQTKKNLSVKEGNPNLCLIRLSNDGIAPSVRRVGSKDKAEVVPYLKELQSILKGR